MEVSSEVALVGKPGGRGDFGQRQLRIAEHQFDAFDTPPQ
jgi:hypothetical protein